MADKREMTRTSTMDVTTKEGKAFLDKNLTPWLKPIVMAHFKEDKDESDSSATTGTKNKRKAGKAKTSPVKKARLVKSRTMVDTAKEGSSLLKGEELGDTRQMTNIKKKVATKTRVNFAPEPKRASLKRAGTMARTIAEAQTLFSISDGNTKSPKSRKANTKAPKKTNKPQLKKGRTMIETAKNAEEYLKKNPIKSNRRSKAGKKK